MQISTDINRYEENSYFAASNSSIGFHSYFNDVFGKLKKLYIIKGGSGTGKSRLMRDIATAAKNKNYSVEYFYCSSDPTSLDGIIVNELDTGIIDGTPPHTYEPKFPGVIDEIWNLGVFWDSDKLRIHESEIAKNTKAKQSAYSLAYDYLNCAEKILSINEKIVSEYLLTSKMDKFISRIIKNVKPDTDYRPKIRLTEAISNTGHVNTLTNEKKASLVYFLADKYGCTHIFNNKVFDEAKNKHIKTEISYSPLSPYKISSIYFPLEKILITSKATDINVTKKIINMDRFISKDFSHVEKQTIKENKKTATTIINRAIGELKLTKKLHDNIEQIYINAMDFKSKEDFTKQCIAKLLGAE